jgi:hypothetical protein
MQNKYVPVLRTKRDIVEKVKNTIEQEKSGRQLGLRTRFGKLNACVGKYFRFKQIISINGLSGHGKSSFLNMILEDFKNPNINHNFKESFIICHNSWEMLPEDEILRNSSSIINKSTLYLLSSELDKETGKYNIITDFEKEQIFSALDDNLDEDHYYFNEPTTVVGLIENIKTAITFYQHKYAKEIEQGTKNKIPKVVTALDHTLLLLPKNNEKTLDIMFNLAQIAIYLKKQGQMVILVGQLNGEIEKPERIKNFQSHYPIKSDIYAQAQIYNACDVVLIIHNPSLLGIVYYGVTQIISSDIIHLQVVKQRFGKVGSIWLKNLIHEGKYVEIEPSTKIK